MFATQPLYGCFQHTIRNFHTYFWLVSWLQALYNKEVTYNFFENGGCEIGRLHPPNDLYFLIPNPTKVKKGLIQFNHNAHRLQFFFRVGGNRLNDWRIQMFAGGSNKIDLFSNRENNNKKMY